MRRLPVMLAVIVGLLGLAAGCGGPAASTEPVVAAGPAAALGDHKAWAAEHGYVLREFDLNRDKVPDVFKFFLLSDDPQNPGNKLESLARKDTDLNHDGKVDVVRFYDAEQRVKEERSDLDFDGRFDEVAVYDAGALVTKAIDLNYDEKPDVTKFFANNVLERVESDKNEDGRIDTWEYYDKGEIDRIGTDNDLDGTVDHWEKKRKTAAVDEAPASGEATPAGSEGEPSDEAEPAEAAPAEGS